MKVFVSLATVDRNRRSDLNNLPTNYKLINHYKGPLPAEVMLVRSDEYKELMEDKQYGCKTKALQ